MVRAWDVRCLIAGHSSLHVTGVCSRGKKISVKYERDKRNQKADPSLSISSHVSSPPHREDDGGRGNSFAVALAAALTAAGATMHCLSLCVLRRKPVRLVPRGGQLPVRREAAAGRRVIVDAKVEALHLC